MDGRPVSAEEPATREKQTSEAMAARTPSFSRNGAGRESNPGKAEAEKAGVRWTADRSLPRRLRRGESRQAKRWLRGLPPSPPNTIS